MEVKLEGAASPPAVLPLNVKKKLHTACKQFFFAHGTQVSNFFTRNLSANFETLLSVGREEVKQKAINLHRVHFSLSDAFHSDK